MTLPTEIAVSAVVHFWVATDSFGVLGTMEEVNAALFPVPRFRPHYLAGIVNHGVYTTGPFSAVHAGLASSTLGAVLSPSESPMSKGALPTEKKSTYLAKLIQDSPPLAASLVSPDKLLEVQLQKLAVNAIINPLSTIFNCFNGELFKSQSIAVLIQVLLQEISAVLCAIMTAKGAEPLSSLSKEGLDKTVADIGAKTAKNISSMRQDVLAGRKTEIDYINGYIIARGVTFGVECPVNRTLVKMVKDKTVISDSQISEAFGI
jgi:2-dehydropantoate 2-reductase